MVQFFPIQQTKAERIQTTLNRTLHEVGIYLLKNGSSYMNWYISLAPTTLFETCLV